MKQCVDFARFGMAGHLDDGPAGELDDHAIVAMSAEVT